MNDAIAQHLNLAEELIQEVQVWAQVLWVRVRGMRPRFVSKKVVRMESQKLQLTHYGRKGIYAYLCPLKIEKGSLTRGHFYNADPIDEGDNKQRFYQGKSSTVQLDLSKFEDGLYEWKEAVGHKSRLGYLKLENGRIVQEWETSQEMIEDVDPLPTLPDLEGTPKQIDWASSIREKALRKGFPLEKAVKVVSAKAWIDNRDKF